MNLQDSSFGPRLHEVETAQAVHEAVCSERYKQITESILALRDAQQKGLADLRTEMAERWVKQEQMMQKMIMVIITVAAVAEGLRKFLNW
jgi:uncharacterized coiled-coil protein SlyX